MSETKKCAKCGKWFLPIPERQNASCCVMHGPNDCCHFAEREVPPPTPDRAAVREALVGVFTHFPYTPELMLAAHRLVHALGIPVDSEAERIADALLARVPAEIPLPSPRECRVCGYAGLRGQIRCTHCAAPRPETGEVSEAMVEAGAKALARASALSVEFEEASVGVQKDYRAYANVVLRAALAARERA